MWTNLLFNLLFIIISYMYISYTLIVSCQALLLLWFHTVKIGWALLGVKIETSMNRLAFFHKVGPGRGEHDAW